MIGADMRWLNFLAGIEVHGRGHLPTKLQVILDTKTLKVEVKKFLPKTVPKFYFSPVVGTRYFNIRDTSCEIWE